MFRIKSAHRLLAVLLAILMMVTTIPAGLLGIGKAEAGSNLPVVTETTPVANALGVALDTEIGIQFSASVIAGVYFDDIEITGGGSVVGHTYDLNGQVLTLLPTGDLDNNMLHTVVIPAGAVKDKTSGKALEQNYQFSFTTAVASTKPLDMTAFHQATSSIGVELIDRYDTGSGDGGAEIVAYDQVNERAYIANGAEKAIDIIDLSTLAGSNGSITPLKRIKAADLPLGSFTANDITSVAVHPDGTYVAATVSADPETDKGRVVLLDKDGEFIKYFETGYLPDMLTFTPDGSKILVANEGEPNDAYTIDPVGSVSIIDLADNSVTDVGFAGLDGKIDADVRIFGGTDPTPEKDLEPEYIVVSADGATAYVVLQENNAVAELDIANEAFTRVHAFGFKDHSVSGNELDASNKDDAINIRNWPVLGMYQPDGIDIFTANGKTYLVTANEGDARDYDGFSEEERIGKIKDNIALNADYYQGYTQQQIDQLVVDGLFNDEKLGRLKITTTLGKTGDNYEALYSYGARSFSIWEMGNGSMEQVFDSGSDFEEITAAAIPDFFNHNKNEKDARSDDKGPEPEDVVIGTVGDKQYAFVGLERMGGVMVYDVTDPQNAKFETYFTSHNFEVKEDGDYSPEGLNFVPADQSPTGAALLLVAHEKSGTVAVYELKAQQPQEQQTITIIHTNDFHGRVASFDRPGVAGQFGGLDRIATIVQEERAKGQPLLVLDAGDTIHGTGIAHETQGQVLIEAMNAIGYDAMAVGNHEFNWGMQSLRAAQEKANFTFLSANLVDGAGKQLFDPYQIFTFNDGDLKVGVFTLSAPPNPLYPGITDEVSRLSIEETIQTAGMMVHQLRATEQVDLIILLSHLGHFEDRAVATHVSGIDVILSGHTHFLLKEQVTVTNVGGQWDNTDGAGEWETSLVENGWMGEYIGILDLTITADELVIDRYLTPIDDQIPSDAAVKAIIDQAYAANQHLANVVGYTNVDLESPAFEITQQTAHMLDNMDLDPILRAVLDDVQDGIIEFPNRVTDSSQETILGNFVTDSIRYAADSDIALVESGWVREGLPQGEITKDDLFRIYPFNPAIQVHNLTGAEILALLEQSVAPIPIPHSDFLQVSGLSFEYDPTLLPGNRITAVTVGGSTLVMDQSYSVAGVLELGGELVTDTGKPVRQAMEEYLAVNSPVTPQIEGRIVPVMFSADLTILHTGDIHGHLDPFTPRRAPAEVGGIARIATLVEQMEVRQPNTILLDAGDTIHGTNLANLNQGKPVIEVMNEIGYAAMAVGNHEFNFGMAVLEQRAEQAEFPFLAANVRYKNGDPVPFFEPYTIIVAGDTTVGVIGLATTDTPTTTHPDNVAELEFLDPVAVTKDIVAQIKDQVDLIVLLAHMDFEDEQKVLDAVPGIAIAISGHTHQLRADIRDDGTILLAGGEHGRILGQLDVISTQDSTVTAHRQGFIPITAAISKRSDVENILAYYRTQLEQTLAEEIGEAAVVLDGERANVRSKETNLGNLVADVLRQKAGADIALQNGGGIRASIDEGPVTRGEVYEVLPFDNYIVALQLTGQQIWQALENGVAKYPALRGQFLQVSGIKFTFDPQRPVGNRIVNVTVGGVALNLTQTYNVATNCFMAAGGDGYTMLKEAKEANGMVDTGAFMRDAVVAYINANSPVAPQVEGRIVIGFDKPDRRDDDDDDHRAGGGGATPPAADTAKDASKAVTDQLKKAQEGDTVAITAKKGETTLAVGGTVLNQLAEKKAKLAVESKEAQAVLKFDPQALLTDELKKAGKDAVVEISAKILQDQATQAAADFAINIGGKKLRAYQFGVTVKEKAGAKTGTKVHNLNGEVTITLDLAGINLTGIDTGQLTMQHKQPDGTWLELKSAFDPKTKTLTFTTDSFSVFMVMEKPDAQNTIKLTIGQATMMVDGKQQTMDVQPYIQAGTNRTMVPVRFVSEMLGAAVEWNGPNRQVEIADGAKQIVLTIGSKTVLVDGSKTTIDSAAEVLPPGRTFVPLRFISETLGAQVNYNETTRQITIVR